MDKMMDGWKSDNGHNEGWMDRWMERMMLDHLIQSLYHGTFLSNTHTNSTY